MGNVERESPGPHSPGWQRDVRPPPPGSRPTGLPPKPRRGRSAEERAAAERRDNAIAALCDFARTKFLPAVALSRGVPPAVVHGWGREAVRCVYCDEPMAQPTEHGPGVCINRREETQ